MSDRKSRFEARDLGATLYHVDEDGEVNYKGPERRRRNRRSPKDRREQVRFELDKPDRRKNQGQRKADKTPKFW